MLAIIISASAMAEGSGGYDIATAYLLIYLATMVFTLSGPIGNLFYLIRTINVDMDLANKLYGTLADSDDQTKTGVNTNRVSVTIEELVLPHGCMFKSQEPLTISFNDKQVVQINGDSGSGKTTFLKCLLGAEEPAAGNISIMRCPATKLSPAERYRLFAYVSQNVDLTPGSLRDNLTMFAEKEVNDREIWEALELVELNRRVLSLPMGLNTPIADARRGFSTGERQRIVLAQSLMKKSEILILDEAMSGLPKKYEQMIFSRLTERFRQIYYVSHRQHMSVYADQVIELSVPAGAYV